MSLPLIIATQTFVQETYSIMATPGNTELSRIVQDLRNKYIILNLFLIQFRNEDIRLKASNDLREFASYYPLYF